MKKIIFATLLALCSISSNAQSSSYRTRGYKGNIELGLNADLSCDEKGFGVFTTHGFQFNRYVFVGGGIGYENEMLPIYADVKSHFIKKNLKVNPWIELKLGVDVLNAGCYVSPSFGISIPVAKDYAVSVAFAYGVNSYYEESNVGLRVGFQF